MRDCVFIYQAYFPGSSDALIYLFSLYKNQNSLQALWNQLKRLAREFKTIHISFIVYFLKPNSVLLKYIFPESITSNFCKIKQEYTGWNNFMIRIGWCLFLIKFWRSRQQIKQFGPLVKSYTGRKCIIFPVF